MHRLNSLLQLRHEGYREDAYSDRDEPQSDNESTQEGPVTTYERITPAMAAEYLATRRGGRGLTSSRVARYADDMTAGRWDTTHQGIAFLEDGELCDGQHRLMAIIKSGVSVVMAVTRGVKNATRMDVGKSRSVWEETHYDPRGALTSAECAVARAMRVLNGAGGGQDPKNIEHAYEHLDAIRFACRVLPSGCGAVGAVRAVIAKAHYSVPEATLSRFCEIIREGLANKDELAAIRLRDFCMKYKYTSSAPVMREYGLLTNSALRNFIKGVPLKVLHPVARQVYVEP